MKRTLLLLLIAPSMLSAQQQSSCMHAKKLPGEITHRQRADNSRSDTIDILNYTISLDITDFTNKRIRGNCAVTLTPKINNTGFVEFDLYQLNVDSIWVDSVASAFTYINDVIKVTLPAPANVGDTLDVTIFYNGNPKKDPSAYGGGFYFSGSYAYNIGVGFAVDPHNFGRAWFPCFDNFIERSTYEFFITTDTLKKAFCNGALADTVHTGNTIIWHWKMNETIPTYLASVAVAPYATVNQTLTGTQGAVPVTLNALPADTTKLKNSFIHLPDAFAAFETSYGPHRFNRVGYNLVPEVGGAMEHATNIAYQRALADGALTYETIMAHELAHHWWGDLATCKTAEDMWINEGMATYSEHLFLEHVYGYSRYMQEVKANLDAVVWKTHEKEEGYRALSEIPHKYTYGEHVYQKGALVAHSLRGYLGDSLFFSGLAEFLNNNKFSAVSSTDMMNELTTITGIDLVPFFTNWVLNPGFPHFAIDSLSAVQNGSSYDVFIRVKQRLTGAPDYYTNVPLQVTFMDGSWNEFTDKIIASGQFSSFTFSVPFSPVLAAVNRDNKINHAVSDAEKVIKATGNYTTGNGRMTLNVTSVSDSALVRVEHNWTAPDSLPYANLKISPNRYWRVDGIFPAGFKAKATVTYDGRTYNYLDHKLIKSSNEDSVILLYRGNGSEAWKEFPYYSKNIAGSNTDKYGTMSIDSLLRGEYAFAYGDRTILSDSRKPAETFGVSVYPNPAGSSFTISLAGSNGRETRARLVDISGKTIDTFSVKDKKEIHTGHLKNGIYFIRGEGEFRFIEKVVIAR